jgi:hypothetical protein
LITYSGHLSFCEFIMHAATSLSSRQAASFLDTLRRAANTIAEQAPERNQRLCSLFGAQKIHDSSQLMVHGWERPADPEIQEIVAELLARNERISILEIGAGSTWGTGERNFGVPGLARAIQLAFPTRTRVAVCDRSQGYEIFFHAADKELVRAHYDDAAMPKLLGLSDIRPNGTLIPASPPFIQASMKVDSKFAEWVSWHERAFGVRFDNSSTSVFIRPTFDPEIEARLFGVRVVPGSIDYLNLRSCLTGVGEVARYDLIFGRHLLPQYFPSRIALLKEVMPGELETCARNSFVQFDRCFFGDEDYADLVFEHREYRV